MKTKLQRLIEQCTELRDHVHDDELSDELDNALISLEAANDRLIQMEEEEPEGDGKDWAVDGEHDQDESYDAMKDGELTN